MSPVLCLGPRGVMFLYSSLAVMVFQMLLPSSVVKSVSLLLTKQVIFALIKITR